MKNIMFTILLLALTTFGQSENKNAANNLITKTSVGAVKLGMTVGEARKVLPKSYRFGEAGGDEGAVFLGIFDGNKLLMDIGLYYYEGDVSEGGKIPKVNEKQKIESITIHDSRYKTAKGVHVGMTIADAEKIFGKIKKIINYPHGGEMGEFANQPKYLSFTFGIKENFASAGIYEEIPDCKEKSNPFLCEVATKYHPGAFISSISIPGDPMDESDSRTDYLITSRSVGRIKLGMTIAEARKILEGYEFSRTNLPYTINMDLGISVRKGGKEVYILDAGEGEVPDSKTEIPINDKLKIASITILDSSYKTANGVHPGMAIASAEKRYGKLKKIERDNHTPEVATFTKTPKGIGFSVDSKKGYAGFYGKDVFLTKRYRPGAFISSITIFTGN